MFYDIRRFIFSQTEPIPSLFRTSVRIRRAVVLVKWVLTVEFLNKTDAKLANMAKGARIQTQQKRLCRVFRPILFIELLVKLK